MSNKIIAQYKVLTLVLLTYQAYTFSLNYTVNTDLTNRITFNSKYLYKERGIQEFIVATAVCGDRIEEALAMLMSCLLFSPKSQIRFLIYTDNILVFQTKLLEWQQYLNTSLQFEIMSFSYPNNTAVNWYTDCWTCSCQRLFFPMLLSDIDALIYLDTDLLVLSHIETLWKHFAEFQATHIFGVAPDHELWHASPYGQSAYHPYYGNSGLNSGVLLMNLTRMRSINWEAYVVSIFHRWNERLNWMDQAIINIFSHYHPERVFRLNCDTNYRAQYCDENRPACGSAVNEGLRVLHGSGRDFVNTLHPSFTAIFKAVRNYQLGTDSTRYFLFPLKSYMRSASASNCTAIIINSIKSRKLRFCPTC